MKAIDPVCGMTVEREKAVATAEYARRTYYFCTDVCRKRFEADPGRYAGDPERRVERADRIHLDR